MFMADRIQKHIEAEELDNYSMESVGEAESARIEEHLLVCETCRRILADTDAYLGGMSRAANQLREDDNRSRGRMFGLLAAAACLLIALSVAWHGPGAPQPAIAVNLFATRANAGGAAIPAGRPLHLQPDLTGLPVGVPYRVEVVDRNGRQVWSGRLPLNQHGLLAPPQHRGVYFVRIYASTSELLREYGLEIR